MLPRSFVFLVFLILTTSACSKRSKAPDKQLDFNLQTSVGDYEKFGKKNSKWNYAATNSLHCFAQLRNGTATPETTATLAESSNYAIELGCDDPLIKYLFLRYNSKGGFTKANETTALEYRDNAAAMQASEYHPIRKFYASLRASQALKSADERKHWQDITALWQSARQSLSEALANPELPKKEVDEACLELMQVTRRTEEHFKTSWDSIEKPLFANWGKTGAPYGLKGWVYNEYAWFARGRGFSDKVAPEKWALFAERLKLAEEALETGWKVDPTEYSIPYTSMRTELGQGKGREVMEMWFQRAMTLMTNSYNACDLKMQYLEPKWYGSPEEMLKFGRECVQREDWGGTVPLVLSEAHSRLSKYIQDPKEKEEYWESDEVWNDIHAAFTRYFATNPENGYRHNYIRFAHLCKRWDVVHEEISKLDEIDYSYFGGEEKFAEMKRLAAEKVANKN